MTDPFDALRVAYEQGQRDALAAAVQQNVALLDGKTVHCHERCEAIVRPLVVRGAEYENGFESAISNHRTRALLAREPWPRIGGAHRSRQRLLCDAERLLARQQVGVIAGAPRPRTGLRARIVPCQRISRRRIWTGVCLSSGWPEIGSTAGLTAALMAPARETCAVQCMGANASPARKESVRWTRSTARPQSLVTSAMSPLPRPRAIASRGCISIKGSGRCPARRTDFPVRVIVCHWSRTRPVFSLSGRSASGACMGGRGTVAIKRARRSPWKKPPSAKKRPPGATPERAGHTKGASLS